MMPSSMAGDLVRSLIIDDEQAVAALEEMQAGTKGLIDQIVSLQNDMNMFGENSAEQLQNINNNLQAVNASLQETADDEDEVSTASTGMGNAFSLALGMVALQAIMQVQQALQTAVDNALAMSQAMVELQTGVNAMNAAGFTTSMEQIKQDISDLVAQYPAFSKLDLTEATAQATYLGQALGLTSDQEIQLVGASADLSEITGGDLNTSMQSLLKASDDLTTSYSRNLFGALGIVIDKQDVYNDAVQMGIEGSAKTYDALSDQAKAQATLADILSQTNKLQQDNNDYNDTTIGQVKTLESDLTDESTVLGSVLTPAWVSFLQIATTGLDALLEIVITTIAEVETLASAISSGNWSDLPEKAQALMDTMGTGMMGAGTTGAPSGPASPTSPSAPESTLPGGMTKANLTDMEKQLIDIQDTYQADSEKDLTDHLEKVAKINEDYQFNQTKEYEDYQADIAKEETDYNDQYLKNEQDYQEKLYELHETYLDNIQDALRDRDATKVLEDNEKYTEDQTNEQITNLQA